MNPVEAGEIHVSPVEDIDGAGLEEQIVQDVDIVDFGRCNADNHRNVAVEIQKRMQLDPGFPSAEFGPRKDRETEIENR